jgi:thiamine biosynthesis lipoprotein
LIAAALVFVALTASAAPPVEHEEARYLMGTVATVRAQAADSATVQSAVDAAWAAMDRVDRLMSTWRDDSDLMRANAGAAAAAVTVDPAVVRVVAAALQVAAGSDGAFDPTVLPLLRAWGLHGGTPREPGDAERADLLAVTGWRFVTADTLANTIGFSRTGVGLDLGGIAKGTALDAARAVMTAAGATAGVVDLGGNLLVFGYGDQRVAVVAPDDPSAAVAMVTVRDGAVATSGQYERFVEIDGRRRGHILDPRTGLPVERRGSVTVIAGDGQLADALSTALFVLGPTAGAALVARHPGVTAVFVGEDPAGSWQVTSHGAAADVTSRQPARAAE